MSDILILRPEPGAGETAARAARLGLNSVVAPLFETKPLGWSAPDASAFDALFVTSANALRFGGLEAFLRVPCYAVGDSTARAATRAGFTDVHIGPSDGEALLAMMAADGVQRAFHPTGRDHMKLDHPEIRLERRILYAAEAQPLSDTSVAALQEGAVALLHSPRAARAFSALVEGRMAKSGISIVAMSAAVADAAGDGWKSVHVASAPRDEALLELAAELCHK